MIGGLFIDSGAFTLYKRHVLKDYVKSVGLHGRELEAPPIRWTQGDFSWFSLKEGSEFRRYCDSYASLIKKLQKKDKSIWFANVDVISNPELSWDSQQYFEKEHGLLPVPVIHSGTAPKWLNRYLESGKYEMLGLGSGGWQDPQKHVQWVDESFSVICPSSKGYMPQVKVHGFGTTSWEKVCRWPWYSVDSSSWRMMSAYGMIVVPKWSEAIGGFCYDREPTYLAASQRRLDTGKPHVSGLSASAREKLMLWLKECKVKFGKVDDSGKVIELGITSHHRPQTKANLTYLQNLCESRPRWPHPLDNRIVSQTKIGYAKGFGL